MKKKLLAMLLAVVMVCGVAGCGKDKTDTTDGQQVTAEPDSEMKKEADLVLSMPDILVVVAIGMPDGLNRLCGKTEVRGIMASHPC